MNPLRITLGVTGGVAAYKAAELVRRLQQDDFSVQVVMTRGAREFVTPLTFRGAERAEGHHRSVCRAGSERRCESRFRDRTHCGGSAHRSVAGRARDGRHSRQVCAGHCGRFPDDSLSCLDGAGGGCAGDEREHVESRGDAGESRCAAFARSARRESRRRLSRVRHDRRGAACGAGADCCRGSRSAALQTRSGRADRADYGWADL